MSITTRQLKAGFWAVDLVFTAVAVFFLVTAIQYLFVYPDHKPDPLTEPPPVRNVGIHSKIRPYRQYTPLIKSNLFGALSSANVAPTKVVEEKLPETTLDLELLGCVSAAEPELSFAIIRDKKKREEDTYSVGDFIVGEAKVEAIRESEVVISRAGKRETLSMEFGKTELPAAGRSPFRREHRTPFTAPQRSSSTSDKAIRVVNENLRYINREKMAQEVGRNLGSLLNQFRTSPNAVDNKPSGIRVDAIGSDPLSSQAGIKPGDIVKSVNGVRVNSLESILELSDRFQNAPEIRVVVERSGRHRTLVYKIR